jgi:AraC-like DNA-binding protein
MVGAAAMGDPETKTFAALPSAVGTVTRLAYAHVRASGCDAAPLLQAAGLTLAQIDDPAVRLKVRDQISFLNLAADAVRDDLIGLHLAKPVDLRELGLLYYVLSSSDTLNDALQRSARYSTIVNEGVCLKVVGHGDVAISFNYVGVSRHLDRHQMEFFATTLVRIARHLTGRRIDPVHVKFMHRRDNVSAEFFELFGQGIEFGAAADEIVFASPVARLPVVSADPYLNKLLIQYCEEALARRPASAGSFRSAVENAIAAVLPHGKARAADVARRLGITQRTLARRLLSEGTTFSGVLEELRCHLAERYLAEEPLSVSQIAWLLGYQEISSFTHAYRRWTGSTPRAARGRAQAE